MNQGKTIQIYLPDGNPRSIRIAEITSRTVQATLIPRAKLAEASARTEIRNVGVYYLIGMAEESKLPQLYVGEAEDCVERLKQHNQNKDFWQWALVITSKTQFFTKTHVKYLEWHSISECKTAGRYSLENGNSPSCPFVPEPVVADLLDNFDTIKTLVATLGYPLFEPIKKTTKKNRLYCKGKDAVATGEYSEEGLIVFSGSKCNLVETRSAGKYVKNWRNDLIQTGILVKDEKVLVFTKDHAFSSPSTAAAVVLARRANGWTEWRYEDGRTLDEVVRKFD